MKRHDKIKAGDTIKVRPGFLVVNTSHATGGIRYERTRLGERPINRGEGVEARHETIKTVDHLHAVQAVDAVVKRVHAILRTHAAWTVMGWIADRQALTAIQAKVAAVREEADRVNAYARQVGSARRAHIRVVPAEIEIASEDAAREIARTIREVLSGLRDELRVGNVGGLHKWLLKAKNLDRLAVGIPGDAIRSALLAIPARKRTLKDAIGRGEAPESAGRGLDLEPIEAAIAWFEEGGIEGGIASALDERDPVEEAIAS